MPSRTLLRRTTSRMTIRNAFSDIGAAIFSSRSDRASRVKCGASSTRCPPATASTS